MANNNVSSLLNVDMPKPKTSNFNLGRVNRFSADPGWTIPCYTEEILPNSYKRLDVEGLIQTNATTAPLMGSFKVTIDAFFIPLRLYYRHLDLNNIRPDFNDDFDYHYISMPTYTNSVAHTTTNNSISMDSLSRVGLYNYPDIWTAIGDEAVGLDDNRLSQAINVAPSSLIDYLGLLPVGYHSKQFTGIKRLNANPFIGYFDIWRNYYANPHDVNVPFRVQNVNNYRDNQFWEVNDVYISLDLFDKFIQNINTRSVTDSGTPSPVDVISSFNSFFKMPFGTSTPTSSESVLWSVPLFASQLAFKPGGLGTTVSLYDTRNGVHFGLLPRTYMDDYFNSRFRNDFVAFLEERSRVAIDDNNSFNITQLRVANRIAKYVDKSIFSDTRFGSWIKAHFGVKTNQKLNIPQFLGSISTNLVFNDIYSTAQTGNGDIASNEALGSRSSLGQGYLKNKGSFIEFRASEPGYIMCIFSIRPYVSYFQGIKKMYLKNSFRDMYKPEFDAIGYDDLQRLELSALTRYGNPYQSYGGLLESEAISLDDYNTSIGKHPAWLEYMTSYDEVHGSFAKRYDYGSWVLLRPYNNNFYQEQTRFHYSLSNPGDFEATTYIRPEFYNQIFAVDKFTDNFQVQLRFFDKTKQPLSKQILPHL